MHGLINVTNILNWTRVTNKGVSIAFLFIFYKKRSSKRSSIEYGLLRGCNMYNLLYLFNVIFNAPHVCIGPGHQPEKGSFELIFAL
jgi:hypothetical protein